MLCLLCKSFFGIKAKIWELATPGADPIKHFLQTFWRQTAHCAHIGVMRYVIARRRPRKIRDRFSNVLQEETNVTIFIQFKTPKKWHTFEQKSPP